MNRRRDCARTIPPMTKDEAPLYVCVQPVHGRGRGSARRRRQAGRRRARRRRYSRKRSACSDDMGNEENPGGDRPDQDHNSGEAEARAYMFACVFNRDFETLLQRGVIRYRKRGIGRKQMPLFSDLFQFSIQPGVQDILRCVIIETAVIIVALIADKRMAGF